MMNDSLPYDPKLKELSKKIKVLLDEYNVVGFVQLVSPTHAEFINILRDWTGMSISDEAIRIRIKKDEVEPYVEWRVRDVDYFRDPYIDEKSKCSKCGALYYYHGWMETPEGGFKVCPGDWIITGLKGEKYPCNPDIFEQTYDPVPEK